eukprot:TRINITY_DN77870_c0_g1_i1.p1 TRINITY_DN77870_c0_g1~~TRINITY_DN77870_c0_g1_i1.p1  ORF type:complete len:271 (+),score=60.36 TRINITY_DN77870_c0_g1_i1:216-1028(+)
MVLIDEIGENEDEENDAVPPLQSEVDKEASASSKLKKGFLNESAESLYGPEGSPEGHVSPETHKAHAQRMMNEDINKGMNRGASDNNGHERPSWYTKEWPKDCQYNSPGCGLEDFRTSVHKSELHKKMARDNVRWEESCAKGAKEMRFSFMNLTDEDLKEILPLLKGNEDVLELDLSQNDIEDAGVQSLVATLAGGAAPNLRELKIFCNKFGDLGKTMLTQGLPVFRKKLDIRWEEPEWLRQGRERVLQAKKSGEVAADVTTRNGTAAAA